MPTYQYACTACAHQLEAVQSFTDDPLVECPECAGRLRKVFSTVGVVFKGSGFYRNDSRPAASTSEGAPKSESKSEASSTKTESTSSTSTSTSAKSESSSSSSSSSSTPATTAA